jgi:hypothetical protein
LQDNRNDENFTTDERHSHNDFYSGVINWLDKNRVSFFWTVSCIISGIVFVIITTITVLTVNLNNKKITELTANNTAMKIIVDEYKQKIKAENKDYLGKTLTRLLPDDKLAALTKDNWAYSLKVNGKDVKKTNNVYIETPNVDITITETLKENDLPEIINVKGSISGGAPNSDVTNFVTVTSTTAKYTMEKSEDGKTKTYNFKYTNLNVGDITTVQLDQNLASRLDLNENIVEIFFSKKGEGVSK